MFARNLRLSMGVLSCWFLAFATAAGAAPQGQPPATAAKAAQQKSAKVVHQKEAKAVDQKSAGAGKSAGLPEMRAWFEPIEVQVNDARGNSGLLNSFEGCLATEPGVDLLWNAFHEVYLVKQKGIAAGLTSFPNSRMGRPFYDGKFVWIAVNPNDDKSPWLFVLDPKKVQSWSAGPKEGLPLPAPEKTRIGMDDLHIEASPLEPGKACIAGSDGRSTWLAVASFDSQKGISISPFHKASRPQQPAGLDSKKWNDPGLAFKPSYMFTIRSGEGATAGTRVIIGRGQLRRDVAVDAAVGVHPLIVDPGAKTVAVIEDTLDADPRNHSSGQADAVYWTEPSSRKDHAGSFDLWRFGFPDMHRSLAATDVYNGKVKSHAVALEKGRALIVADTIWTAQTIKGKYNPILDSNTEADAAHFKSPAWSSVYHKWLLMSAEDPTLGVDFETIKSDWKSPSPRQTPPTADRPGSTVTRAVVFHDPVSNPNDASRDVLFLSYPIDTLAYRSQPPRISGILSRELILQAFLIAARDGLGTNTRDEVLGDRKPDRKPRAYFDIESLFIPRESVHLAIRNLGPTDRKTVFAEDFPLAKNPSIGFANLIEHTEALSRGAFVETLRPTGQAPAVPKPHNDSALPKGTQARLDQMTFSEQFAVVREVHQAIQANGESPDLLGALARGYAQLGVLTEFHWNSSHKVFKARSLLYAQRLAALHPDSPVGYWHRAFAEALTGFHKLALDDLAQAQKRMKALEADKNGSAKTSTQPAWVPIIDAYCHDDLKRLDVAIGEPAAALAHVLRYRAIEFAPGTGLVMQVLQKGLEAQPDCFRLIDGLCSHGGVSALHTATLLGPQIYSESLPKRLQGIPNLPAKVAQFLTEENDPDAIQALLDPGIRDQDQGEPSWTTLGRMAGDVRFVHAFRRLSFMKYLWDVPVDDFMPEAIEMTLGHPYRGFIESFALDHDRRRSEVIDTLKTLEVHDAEDAERPLFDLLARQADARLPAPLSVMARHRDPIARDFALTLREQQQTPAVGVAEMMLEVCPSSAHARALLIRYDWNKVQNLARDWEKEAPENPFLLEDLSRQYIKQKRVDDAERCLKQYVKLSPDRWAYQTLADLYRTRGDMVHWKSALDEFLQKPEYALDHVQVRVQIADQLMSEKRWNDALPYALGAAESWALFGMNCASRCYEGMEDWANAELWLSRGVERYPIENWFNWLYWCRRTGHGDSNAAEETAAAYISTMGEQLNQADLAYLLWFYVYTHQDRKAIPYALRLYEPDKSQLFGFVLVALADEFGDKALRDKTLTQLIEDPRSVPHMKALSIHLRNWFALGKNGSPNLPAIETELAKFSPPAQGWNDFIVWRLLENRGKIAESRKYLERCARNPKTFNYIRIFCIGELHAKGVHISS